MSAIDRFIFLTAIHYKTVNGATVEDRRSRWAIDVNRIIDLEEQPDGSTLVTTEQLNTQRYSLCQAAAESFDEIVAMLRDIPSEPKKSERDIVLRRAK